MNLTEQYNRIGGKQLINEASLKSNIMQKWDTTQVIEKDLVEFINSAQDASGTELFREEELSDEEFNIQEWQKRFLDKRNLKWG